MKTARSLIAAAALSTCSLGATAGPNLITNGSFEAFVGNPVAGYTVVNAGSFDLIGWSVGGISVDVINGAYGAINGNSIDMLGTPGPGSLSQSFSTAVGQSYLLSFDLSQNPGDSPFLGVSFNGGKAILFAGTNTATHYTFDYTASSASTTLLFTSASGGYSGAVLDNVSVTAVPEPETYAMMLAGLGLMGFIARRRKKSLAAA